MIVSIILSKLERDIIREQIEWFIDENPNDKIVKIWWSTAVLVDNYIRIHYNTRNYGRSEVSLSYSRLKQRIRDRKLEKLLKKS